MNTVPGAWKRANWKKCTAWREWQALAQTAVSQGMGDLVEVYQPHEGAGWREVDRMIGMLRKAMQERDYETYKV